MLSEKCRENFLFLKIQYIIESKSKIAVFKDIGLNQIPVEFYSCLELEVIDLSNSSYDSQGGLGDLSAFEQLRWQLSSETPEKRIKNLVSRVNNFEKLRSNQKLQVKLELKEIFEYEISNKCIHPNFRFNTPNVINNLSKDILKLVNLKTLNLKGNLLEEIPEYITESKSLEYIFLKGNPILSPPAEICIEKKHPHGNLERIRKYYESSKKNEGIDYLFEAKLILLGEERSGKTSISNAISDKRYQFNINQESTEGITIGKWIVPKNELESARNFRINVWDFGGQEIYHSTHQFFLTKRSIYFLVTEARKDVRHDDFYYWLNIIETLGGDSPVVIIVNKCDQPNTGFAIKEYKERFSNIVDVIKVSCKPEFKFTIRDLKKSVLEILSDKELLPDIGMPLPKAWVKVRSEIEYYRKVRKYYFLEYSVYLRVCRKYGLDEDKANFLSRFFHDLGIFLHFEDDFDLRETIFLDFQWVTDAVYNVLDNKKVIDNNGIFDYSTLDSIWSNSKFYKKKRELLALMKNDKFELCFPFGRNKFLAPQLLSHDPICVNWTSKTSDLIIRMKYKFMPKGIVSRLMVRMYKYIEDKNSLWRYGVVFNHEESRALIQELYFDKVIEISMRGDNVNILFSIVRKNLSEIHENFQNIKVDELIQCNCSECINGDEPRFYSLVEDIEKRVSKGRFTIECRKSFEVLKIKDLISRISVLNFPNNEKPSSILSALQELIIKNNVQGAINFSIEYFKKIDRNDVCSLLTIIASRFSEIESKQSTGVIRYNDYMIHINKLKSDLLKIVEINI